MKAFLKRLKSDVFGGTAMEYGLILALMFVAMAGAFQGFANESGNLWNTVSTTSAEAMNKATN